MSTKSTEGENMLNVLMYLFENYMQDGGEIIIERNKLTAELHQIGFEHEAIDRALSWLDGLSNQQKSFIANPPKTNSIRIFGKNECRKMDTNCRSQIMQLERMGILTATTRELVINQIMELEPEQVNIGQVKWVALMVLFHQPDQRKALSCLEHLVLTDSQGVPQ